MSAPSDTLNSLASYVDQLAALNALKLPVPLPPPPTPDPNTLYADSFDGSALNPVWQQIGLAAWVVSGGVLTQSNVSAADPRKLVLNVPVPSTVDVSARVRVNSWVDGDYTRAGIGVRTFTDGRGLNLLFRSGGRVQFLNDAVAWSVPFAFPWSVGQWYGMRLRVEGTSLLGKIWSDGTPEPADWMFTQSLTAAGWTNRTSGSVSLNGSSAGASVSFDDVAVLGQPVPPPPPLPPTGDFTIQIVPVGLSANQLAICQRAATRLMRIVVGPKATLAVTINSMAIDGTGGIVGSSSPTHYAGTPLLPVTAASTFDSADVGNMEANGSLLDVITHELLHCLGLGTAPGWGNQLTGANTTDPQFHGPQAVAAYNAVLHNAALSVPVENQGGMGTAGEHWRESVFGNELFTGFYNGGVVNPLSRVTAGALADLGYTVNLDAVDSYPA